MAEERKKDGAAGPVISEEERRKIPGQIDGIAERNRESLSAGGAGTYAGGIKWQRR